MKQVDRRGIFFFFMFTLGIKHLEEYYNSHFAGEQAEGSGRFVHHHYHNTEGNEYQ